MAFQVLEVGDPVVEHGGGFFKKLLLLHRFKGIVMSLLSIQYMLQKIVHELSLLLQDLKNGRDLLPQIIDPFLVCPSVWLFLYFLLLQIKYQP